MTATSAYIVSVIHTIDSLVNIGFVLCLVFIGYVLWFSDHLELENAQEILKKAGFLLALLVVLMIFIPNKTTLNLMFDVPGQCQEVTK